MPFIIEIRVVLQASKIVQDVGEAPAGVAQRGPAVVVLRRAPLREARICRRAPTHDSSTRNLNPAVEFLVGRVAPVVVERRLRRVEDVSGERCDICVVWTRLDQKHLATSVLAETVREYTAGRTAADNDDVEVHWGGF